MMLERPAFRIPLRTTLLLFLTVVVLLLVLATAAQSQSVRCPTAAADTTGWTTYDEGDFSIKIPPDFDAVKIKGIDSQVGRWKADRTSVFYDYGRYSNPLDPKEQGTFPGLTVCQEGQGPNTPRIVVYRDEDTGRVRMGAHWAKLPDGFHSSESLTISGAAPDEKNRAEMLAIIQSVRFTPKEE